MQDMEKIYRNYSKLVYNYLVCLSQDYNLSEELTQETFYIAVKDIGKFKGECQISTWLCSIAKRLWYKEIRNKKEPTLINEEINYSNMTLDLENEIIKNDEKERIYKQIQKLEPQIKDVILLRVTGDLSFKKIGEILGKNENWARVNFYRGKEKLKEIEENEKNR